MANSFISYFNPANWIVNLLEMRDSNRKLDKTSQKSFETIGKSNYISRDLSWLKFDERVLDQARDKNKSIFDRLKFLAITASNLDEFFTIRVGSIYNYIDLGKERLDYSGLREEPFKNYLIASAQEFAKEKNRLFLEDLYPEFEANGFSIVEDIKKLFQTEQDEVNQYFRRTIYPMLTPMVYDFTHTFPSLLAKTLIFGVVSKGETPNLNPEKEERKISFIQIPLNLPRFYIIERDNLVLFIPLEIIIRNCLPLLYKNVDIESISLFRITRNGDFDVEEHEDSDKDFVDEVKQKIKDRRLGRVTRVEAEKNYSKFLIGEMLKRWNLDEKDIFVEDAFLDFTAFSQILKYPEFKSQLAKSPPPVPPLGTDSNSFEDIFETMKKGDILLHHPYNSFEPVIQLLEQSAEDPQVLAIKVTLYRISKNSRVSAALLRAAENGKHVSVLFEVKARFDEENNIREATKLQKAGCFVIYGIPGLKTHTKLLQVIRNEGTHVMTYAHLASGNYNEETSKLYTDIGLLTTDSRLTEDISEFFNVITGHSLPTQYQHLITAPRDLRNRLLDLIQEEINHHQQGQASGICWKVNSLQDDAVIAALYRASQAGVPIYLIVRGICCIRPHRKNLSENIFIKSIVGEYLEHSRLYYFHQAGNPMIYGGSADVMVRSFDRRIESLFEIVHPTLRSYAITILDYNLKDTVNSYEITEDGSYWKVQSEKPFNIHKEFYNLSTNNLIDKIDFKRYIDTVLVENPSA